MAQAESDFESEGRGQGERALRQGIGGCIRFGRGPVTDFPGARSEVWKAREEFARA